MVGTTGLEPATSTVSKSAYWVIQQLTGYLGLPKSLIIRHDPCQKRNSCGTDLYHRKCQSARRTLSACGQLNLETSGAHRILRTTPHSSGYVMRTLHLFRYHFGYHFPPLSSRSFHRFPASDVLPPSRSRSNDGHGRPRCPAHRSNHGIRSQSKQSQLVARSAHRFAFSTARTVRLGRQAQLRPH
jgi:hypothetical protein